MNSKRLHLHAMPIVIAGASVAYVSAYALIHVMMLSTNSTSFTSLIGAHLYSIKPASNGLFHITRDVSDSQADAQTSVTNSTIGQTFMTGQDAELQGSLEQ